MYRFVLSIKGNLAWSGTEFNVLHYVPQMRGQPEPPATDGFMPVILDISRS